MNVKVIVRAKKKDYSWNPGTCNCENSKYVKSTSVTECDEIMSVMDAGSTKKTNVTVLFAIVLLLITFFCFAIITQSRKV